MDVTIRFSEVLHAAARVGFNHSGYAVELASVLEAAHIC